MGGANRVCQLHCAADSKSAGAREIEAGRVDVRERKRRISLAEPLAHIGGKSVSRKGERGKGCRRFGVELLEPSRGPGGCRAKASASRDRVLGRGGSAARADRDGDKMGGSHLIL
jgi:hypothetical protein